MKIRPLACFALFLLVTGAASAQEPDITKREITDPQLKISSATSLLPEKDDKMLGGTRDEKHVPQVYKILWGKRDVIMLEPFSREKPGVLDFSAITKNSKGTLRLSARNHPNGDFLLEILKKGEAFKSESVGGSKWERYTIPFDHEEVVVRTV
eukprot:gene40311-49121_t